MNKKEQEGFYFGAAMYYDLDSVEVDILLEAEGLSADLHTSKQCTAAVRKYLHHTPAGPCVDIETARAKAATRAKRN